MNKCLYLFLFINLLHASSFDIVDNKFRIYPLNDQQLAQFSTHDNLISPFWSNWDNNSSLDYISMSSAQLQYARNSGSCPFTPNINDAILKAKGCYNSKGVYFYFEAVDNSWRSYQGWWTDVIDVYIDTLPLNLMADKSYWFNPTQWALTKSSRHFQLPVGDAVITLFNMRLYDELAYSITDHALTNDDNAHDSLSIEVVSINSNTRKMEAFIPWSQWGFSRSPIEGQKMAFTIKYNDEDIDRTDCVSSLTWIGLCDPYCEPPSASLWGEIELYEGQVSLIKYFKNNNAICNSNAESYLLNGAKIFSKTSIYGKNTLILVKNTSGYIKPVINNNN